MKRMLILAFVLLAGVAKAQENGKYETGMTKALEQLKVAKTVDDMVAVSALFERIADAEKTKWLPFYYAAYTNYVTGWMDPKADKDKIGDKSLTLLEKAEALETNNAELYCLRQMIAVLQMMVDPSTRWQTFGLQANKALENAKKADPNNPRIYYLEGQSIYNTPEAYGGGKKAALPKFEKAVELFASFQTPSVFHPDWGKEEATKMLEECKK